MRVRDGRDCLHYLATNRTGEPVQHSFNVNLPIWDPSNATPAKTPLSAYLCPTAVNTANTYNVVNSTGTVLATFSRSNYVANAGRVEVWDGATVAAAADLSGIADGPFYRNSRTQIRDVTDGLSNTVFFGEQTPTHSDSTWVGIVPNAQTCPTAQFAIRSDAMRRRRRSMSIRDRAVQTKIRRSFIRRTATSATWTKCIPVTIQAATCFWAMGPCDSRPSSPMAWCGRILRRVPGGILSVPGNRQ